MTAEIATESRPGNADNRSGPIAGGTPLCRVNIDPTDAVDAEGAGTPDRRSKEKEETEAGGALGRTEGGGWLRPVGAKAPGGKDVPEDTDPTEAPDAPAGMDGNEGEAPPSGGIVGRKARRAMGRTL